VSTETIRFISLGWGVQSWTLAAMVALGELPMVDAAIHSDTTHERSATYAFARRWTPWLESHGVRVVTVSDADQAATVTTKKTDIPAFTKLSEKRGQLRRQCTGRWKITPMRRWIAAELKRSGIKKTPGVVEQWLGITLDEWHRAKDSDVQYIVHRYPLLEMDMTRGDCLAWLKEHNLPSPGKSACVFCPYQSPAKWHEMKRQNSMDWRHAVEVDAAIRDVRSPFELFVHSARLPLPDAVAIPEDHGMVQSSIFNEECDSGYCFF
jgi:hypothetical protein